MVLRNPVQADIHRALDERSGEIFRRIVESYLEHGEPLGSRNLSRILPMSLSPASVRNVMSDLEALGLIYSPHVSAGRLPTQQWPDRALLITAVDAHTGEAVVFDRRSGVDIVDAVAASTSSGAAYRIGEHAYIDGGYRRNENADLAAGHERVLVLSPFGGRSRHPVEWGMQLAAQVDELRAGGSRVEVIVPDGGAGNAFGVNAMDPSLRAPAARAGHDLGRARAQHLRPFWR